MRGVGPLPQPIHTMSALGGGAALRQVGARGGCGHCHRSTKSHHRRLTAIHVRAPKPTSGLACDMHRGRHRHGNTARDTPHTARHSTRAADAAWARQHVACRQRRARPDIHTTHLVHPRRHRPGSRWPSPHSTSRLDVQLGAAPVPPLRVVANRVVRAHADPLRDGAVLLGGLGQLLLDAEGLVGGHGG